MRMEPTWPASLTRYSGVRQLSSQLPADVFSTACYEVKFGKPPPQPLGFSTRCVDAGYFPSAPGGRRGLVECCYVESGARAVGVGSALLEAAVAWCEAQGGLEVDALALPGDRATKQRLEAAGFRARLLTLSRRSD